MAPLEQFEPVSFFSIFLGNVNLSFTNISLTFIFIMLVISFLINGYFFYFASASNTVNVNINASKNYNVKSINSNVDFNITDILVNSNNSITYTNLLASRFSLVSEFNSYKSSKINSTGTDNNKFLSLFLRTYYNFLKSRNLIVNKLGFVFLNSYFCDFVSAYKTQKNSKLFAIFNNVNSDRSFKRLFIPTALIFIFESIYQFILDQVKSGIEGENKTSVKFFPVIFLLFNFILVANLLGLIPYGSTVTAYIIITITLAMMV